MQTECVKNLWQEPYGVCMICDHRSVRRSQCSEDCSIRTAEVADSVSLLRLRTKPQLQLDVRAGLCSGNGNAKVGMDVGCCICMEMPDMMMQGLPV